MIVMILHRYKNITTYVYFNITFLQFLDADIAIHLRDEKKSSM